MSGLRTEPWFAVASFIRDAVAQVGLEVEIAPPVALPAPDERPAAHLVAADPVEAPHFRVRVFLVVDEEVRVVGVHETRPALHVLGVRLRRGEAAAARQLPRIHVHRGVVGDVTHHPAALEDQRLEAFLAQLLRGPAAADAGTDDDRVVRVGTGLH
jgi:hypothetical protein